MVDRIATFIFQILTNRLDVHRIFFSVGGYLWWFGVVGSGLKGGKVGGVLQTIQVIQEIEIVQIVQAASCI